MTKLKYTDEFEEEMKKYPPHPFIMIPAALFLERDDISYKDIRTHNMYIGFCMAMNMLIREGTEG